MVVLLLRRMFERLVLWRVAGGTRADGGHGKTLVLRRSSVSEGLVVVRDGLWSAGSVALGLMVSTGR